MRGRWGDRREQALLQTARLRLRPAGPGDLRALHALWTSAPVRRYLLDGTVVSRRWSLAMLAASDDGFAHRGAGMWVVERRAAPGVVGFCALRPEPPCPDIALMYGMAPGLWRRGLTFEAATAVLRYGFEELGLPRIAGGVDAVNSASVRLLEKLGMSFVEAGEGAFGELRWYQLTAPAFRRRHAHGRRSAGSRSRACHSPAGRRRAW